MCCSLANFLIKVYESAADSSCYLSSWAHRSEWKEKLPRRENSGHFDVTRLHFKRRKGQQTASRWFLWLRLQIVH